MEEAGTAEARLLPLSVSKLHEPLPFDADAIGIRVHAPFEQDMVEHESYIDLIVFSAGHAEITLSTLGMPTPVSQDVERQLVSTLIERAERHAL